ncbi:hypothetical protein DFH08DRAFT_613831, partial [Mycena albidolilacea]
GQGFVASQRPDTVSWWVQRGRNTSRIPAGLSSDDKRQDFYEGVILWWLAVNPAWRQEGVTKVEDFAAHGLNTRSGGDLESLPSGLNGLTSVLACLEWWYHLAGIAEGTPEWRKLVEDVVWVL